MHMTKRVGWLVAVLLVLAAGEAAAQAQTPVRSDQEILIQLERDWVAALHRNDADFIATILAEEFVATYGDGARGDKKKELELVAGFDRQVDKYALEDFIVKIYRDTAVVLFTQHMVGPVQGVPTEIVSRYTDVFVFRDGRWQCVASHSTRVRE